MKFLRFYLILNLFFLAGCIPSGLAPIVNSEGDNSGSNGGGIIPDTCTENFPQLIDLQISNVLNHHNSGFFNFENALSHLTPIEIFTGDQHDKEQMAPNGESQTRVIIDITSELDNVTIATNNFGFSLLKIQYYFLENVEAALLDGEIQPGELEAIGSIDQSHGLIDCTNDPDNSECSENNLEGLLTTYDDNYIFEGNGQELWGIFDHIPQLPPNAPPDFPPPPQWMNDDPLFSKVLVAQVCGVTLEVETYDPLSNEITVEEIVVSSNPIFLQFHTGVEGE